LAFPRKSKRIPSEQLAVFASEELNRGQRGSQKRVSIEAGVGRAKERRRSMVRRLIMYAARGTAV